MKLIQKVGNVPAEDRTVDATEEPGRSWRELENDAEDGGT